MLRAFLFLLCAIPVFAVVPTCTGYAYYSTITLPTPGSTLTDFPVTVSGTLTDLKTVGNGGKLQNTETISTPYSHAVPADFVLRDTDGTTAISNFEFPLYTATTGFYELYIKYASLTTGGGTIYACYGKASVTTFQGNVNGTWNSAYVGVWHLPNGSSLSAADSTSNTNNGTITGVTATAGQIDGAGAFSGTLQYIDVGNGSSLGVTGDITISCWVNPTDRSQYNALLAKTNGPYPNPYELRLDAGTGTLNFGVGEGTSVTGGFTSATPIANGSWSHVAVTLPSGAAVTGTFYINGTLDVAAAGLNASAQTNGAVNGLIGTRGDLFTMMKGSIDECRLSNVVRSADWLAEEYSGGNAPKTLSGANAFATTAIVHRVTQN